MTKKIFLWFDKYKIIIISFSIIVLYWWLESFCHAVILQDGSYIKHLFSPGWHELVIRLTAVFSLLFSGIFFQYSMLKVNKLTEIIETNNKKLEKTVQVRTERLVNINSELEIEIKENKKLRERLELILTLSKTGLHIIDSHYALHYVENSWKRIYGDPAGKKCYEYFMDRTDPCPNCKACNALESKTRMSWEHALIKEDNRPIQVISVPFQDDNDKWLLAKIFVDIGDRKKEEEKTKRFLRAIEAAHEAIILTDIQGNITFANESALKAFNYSNEKIMTMSLFDIIDHVKESILDNTIQQGKWDGETVAFKNDHKSFPILISLSLLKDNSEIANGTIAIIKDITEQKETETLLKERERAVYESKEKFRILVETMNDWIWEVDKNGIYTYASPRIKDMLGYEPEEVLGKSPMDLMPKDEAQRIAELFTKIVQNKEAITRLENTNIHKNGSYVTLETNAIPILNSQGELLGYRGVDRDITERKNMENWVKRVDSVSGLKNKISNILLISTNDAAMYGEIIDTLSDVTKSEGGILGYMQTNGSLVITLSTNLCKKYSISENILIFPKEKLEGLFNDSLIHNERLHAYTDNWILKEYISAEKIMSTPIIHGNEYVGLIQVINKTDNYKDDDKKFFKDIISEISPFLYIKLKNREEQEFLLSAEKEKLELEKKLFQSQKMESIGTLAAGIAHEINTPIQFIGNNTNFILKSTSKLLDLIKTYRELLSTSGPSETSKPLLDKADDLEEKYSLSFLEKEIPTAISETKEGVDRVAKIVKAMKDFSHIGSDKKERADISKAIESTLTISKNEWKYVADIKTDFAPSLLIDCYIWDIKQVILNLIVNAAHAIRDKCDKQTEEKGLITVTTRQEDNQAVIAVSDTGTGIPEHARDKVFDPFFTTKEVGKGTGQGLSLAYSVIYKKHKGDIRFETEMGKGTTFFITLPINSEKEVEK